MTGKRLGASKKRLRRTPERKAWNWKDVNAILWKSREERVSRRRQSAGLSATETSSEGLLHLAIRML